MMKRFLTGLAMLAASTALASAADLGVKPVVVPVTPTLVSAYTWSGLYVGAQVGYSWNADDWRNVPGGPNAEGWLAAQGPAIAMRQPVQPSSSSVKARRGRPPVTVNNIPVDRRGSDAASCPRLVVVRATCRYKSAPPALPREWR